MVVEYLSTMHGVKFVRLVEVCQVFSRNFSQSVSLLTIII